MKRGFLNSKPYLLDEIMKFKEASEPDNIIWETKHIRGKTLYRRVALVVTFLVVILFITFGAVIKIKSYASHLNSRIPFSNCEDFFNNHDDSYIRMKAGMDLEKASNSDTFIFD